MAQARRQIHRIAKSVAITFDHRAEMKTNAYAQLGAAHTRHVIDADLHFDGVGTSLANVAGKRVKAIAITSERRMAANPDIPTFVEAGLPNMVAYSWYGIVTPAGTPPSIIQKLNEEINRYTQQKETAERMARDGSEVGNMTPPQFARMIADEAEMWRQVLLPLNIKFDQ